jgi:GTPase SAR1 family protein
LEGVTKVLVGNQIDKDDRKVSTEEGRLRAKELGVEYFETSAKTGVGISELFAYMAINTRYVEDNKLSNPRTSVRLSQNKERKKCCGKNS